MGCVIHFALTSGKHPFGSDLDDFIRQTNIKDNNPVDLITISKYY